MKQTYHDFINKTHLILHNSYALGNLIIFIYFINLPLSKYDITVK